MKPAKSFVLSNLTVLYGDTQSPQENAQLSDTDCNTISAGPEPDYQQCLSQVKQHKFFL